MRSYRCYFLNDARTISDVEVVECPDDAAAIRAAPGLLLTKNHGRSRFSAFAAVEIWEADRLVGVRSRDPVGT